MITLTLRGSVWTARYDGEEGAQIRDLFGCDEIPTPYTEVADPDTVRRAIAGRNPTHTVMLACATCGGNLRHWGERGGPCEFGHPL
jgi:hypothetical protein